MMMNDDDDDDDNSNDDDDDNCTEAILNGASIDLTASGPIT